MAFPVSSLLDNFTRSDASPIDGNWAKLRSSDFVRLTSNKAENIASGPNSYGGAYWTTATFDRTVNTVEVWVTLGGTFGSSAYTIGVSWANQQAGSDSTIDNYVCEWSIDGSITLYKGTNGSWGFIKTIKAIGTITLVDGYKLGVSHDADGLISVYYDTGSGWTLAGTHTDTSYSTGYIGIWGFNTAASAGNITWDDFGGGYATSAATALPSRALSGPFYGSLRGSVQ
jgi:hypothetical protein